MKIRAISRHLAVLMILGVFALGYVCGSLSQRYADAQVGGGLGGALEKAGGMGGPVGSIAQMGSSLVEMQDHVTGLQKNIDSLKKVQAALTGK
jgi:hypothetical protein